MKLYWYLVPSDGPFPWKPEGRRAVDLDYLRQLAGAIDQLGFEGALVAGGGGGHDLWTLSSFLAAHTRRMKFIIAQHPGQTSPLLMAQKAATFDQLSSGRLIINIVNGGDNVGPPHGVFLSHDDRYEMADEYWGLWSRIIQGEHVTHEGKYFKAAGARLQIRPWQTRPELHFGGSSPAALRVAAKHVDTYLTYGEPPPEAALKIREVDALATPLGRKLEYGVRLHVIVRETKKEAWDAAQWLYDRMDRESVEANRRLTEASRAVSQSRMNALNEGPLPKDARALEIYPDLWSGIGLTRVGNAVAIVGDPETVVRRIRDYESRGFGTFILSGYPLIEEAYRFADLVMPLLRERSADRTAPRSAVQ
ncbi:MAG TPA: LLM class flavin-dependent oxidoreductase [Polyangiaceae bacterium]|nr:LLM class flavin-dependent oxidoreductase [Polyangiaceae bacterium]